MSIIDKPTDYFNTITYSGNGSNPRTLTGVGFQPDWTWLKNRTDGNGHTLADSVRGANKTLSSDGTAAEVTDKSDGHLDAFTSDGFTVGAGISGDGRVNDGSHTYVAWNWLAGGTASSNTDGSITSSVSANTTSGFSIVSYTGTGSNATVGHGLGVAPKVVIIKSLSASYEWRSYFSPIGAGKYMILNENYAEATASNFMNDTVPTSSVFSLGSGTTPNGSGTTYIAYCFAEKQGYSKFGSFVGNGSNNGTFCYTGFKPAFVIVKESSGTSNWLMFDNKRDISNGVDAYVKANASDGENSGTDYMDFVSNGFKCRNTQTFFNESGSSYIYMAFAENPFTTSTGVCATAR